MANERESDKQREDTAIESQPAVGAYLCESTAKNAGYWLDAAREEQAPNQKLLFAEQAINAWKNLAYGLARSAHYYQLQQTGAALSHVAPTQSKIDSTSIPSQCLASSEARPGNTPDEPFHGETHQRRVAPRPGSGEGVSQADRGESPPSSSAPSSTSRSQSMRNALRRLLACINDHKGHGLPTIKDRAECYAAMQEAEAVLGWALVDEVNGTPSSATRLNPLELQHLVDFHDNAAAGSEAQDYFDSARFHEERSKLFKAMLITPDGTAKD